MHVRQLFCTDERSVAMVSDDDNDVDGDDDDA